MTEPKTLRLPSQIRLAPTGHGGVYLFSIRYPSDSELGMGEQGTSLDHTYTNISNFLNRTKRAYSLDPLSGTLTNTKAHHLRCLITLSALQQVDPIGPAHIKSCLTPGINERTALIHLNKIFRMAFAFAPPLYVGIAEKQSLRDRLSQHVEGHSTFSQRLSDLAVTWDMLNFSYYPIRHDDLSSFRNVEKLVQYLLQPSLSTI